MVDTIKKGMEVTHGCPQSPLLVPDFPMPLNKEVDFFDFLIAGYSIQVKKEKKELVPDGGLGTNNNAEGAGANNGANKTQAPTMVPEDNGARG